MSILKGVRDRIDVKVIANVDTDHGKTLKVPFVITSKKPTQEERKAVMGAIKDGVIDDEALLREYLLGWHSLPGADGADVPFSDEAVQEVLQSPEYLQAVVTGILTAIAGKEALTKN